MLASEKMKRRVVLVRRLSEVDEDLVEILGKPASNRVTAEARSLLRSRARICDEMAAVGYHPWPVPVDAAEVKVS